MATKTFYVVRDMKHPLYRTRMLRAGDELQLSGPDSRLYRQLGVISETRPKTAPYADARQFIAPEGTAAPNAASRPAKKAPAKRKAPAKKKAAPKK